MTRIPKWELDSRADFLGYVRYLKKNWPSSVGQRFLQNMETAQEQLASDPYQYRIVSDKRAMRRCRVDRYISLYYIVDSEKDQARILYFHHASRDPGRLEL